MHRLSVLVRLAWRYLWRNHRRTIIMVGAVSVGCWAMIFMTALTRGMVDQMISDGISALPGHVQAHHPDFLDDPSVTNRMDVDEQALAAALRDSAVRTWASRVRVPAVITSERESRGVTLLGIDPEAERAFSFVDYDTVDGRFLESVDDDGIVIGAKLAATLDTEVGKRIVIMSQDPDNEIADRGFRVIGLFHANMESFEENYVFTGRATAQALLRIGAATTELVFLGDDYRNVEPVFAAAQSALGDRFEIRRWFDVDTYLGSMLRVMDGFMLIWVIVIFLALSFGLVNTLVMAVFERVREIGLMLALGMKPAYILGQILLESMMLLAIGLLLGDLLAWATIVPLESGIDISIVAEGMEMMGASSVLYPQLNVADVVMSNVVVLVLGFVASLSPAWRASRYEPVEAIRKVG